MTDPGNHSEHCTRILHLLRERNNVLISGSPATGKSRLLTELGRAFKSVASAGSAYQQESDHFMAPAVTTDWLPSPGRADRKVFVTAFDQSTHQRDVLRGLVPRIDGAGSALGFTVSRGILYRAAEHARTADGAALLIIDEINRGPAVAAFGASIVALERDKRLGDGGERTETTQSFELLGDDGEMVDFELPGHLYLVGAMNQADASVAPLDVAFQRRFAPYRLAPEPPVLHKHFGIDEVSADGLPADPGSPAQVYTALVAAWQKVNERLTLGRGAAFQLGHGALMHGEPPQQHLNEALNYAAACWELLRAHVDEVFFGDTRGIAATISAGLPGSPYEQVEATFAEQPVLLISPSGDLDPAQVYRALKAIAESG